jgi:membrane-associated PAP2 superfamily phosphatase
MNRTGLLVALAIAAIVGVVFGVDPKLDLAFSTPFFDPGHRGSWAGFGGVAGDLREYARYTVAALVAPAGVAILGKLVRPRRPMLIPGRAAVLMIATLALAPGMVANMVLKQHWGRPRPIDVVEFGGDQHFVAWWDPRGDCPDNCSFVAGEPSAAFWTLAPAVLVPPALRALATTGALAFGTVIGVDRMVAGGHFFTDVVFSGVFTFLIIWLAHGLIYRWSATRISDRAIERALERLAQPLRGARPILPPSEPADPPGGQLRPDPAKKGG